ncbi:hypothetical protein [Streptomyces luridiscabiei]|uniref:hypothetical protein n=1 Tax=Streptomyces luridiscabiei TaxID=164114 RepID=UPI000AFF1ABF|nr:hypothetical protein [Streptomyces luridiscabiei]
MSGFPEKMWDVLTDAWEEVWDFIVEAFIWVLMFGVPAAFVLVDLAVNHDLVWTQNALNLVSKSAKSFRK